MPKPLGMRELLSALDDMSERVDKGVRIGVQRAAQVAVGEMKRSIKGRNDGRRRSDGRYTDAVLGGAPMNRTGNLRRSIHATAPVQQGFAMYSATAGPGAMYARALELGLSNGATYPTVGPAQQRLLNSGAMMRVYKDALKNAVRR